MGLGIASLAIGLLAGAAPPAEAPGETLAPRDATTVPVYAGSFPPYVYRDADGRATGLMVEILTRLGAEAGIRFEVRIMPWARAQLWVGQEQRRAMILPLTRTAAREPRYDWVVPLLHEPLAMMVTDPALAGADFAALRARPVAVQTESPNAAFLREQGFTALNTVNAEATAARMLRHGRVDGWFARPMVARAVFRRVGGDPEALHVGAVKPTPPMFLGATREGFSEALLARLRAAFARLETRGTLAALRERY